MTAQLTRWHRLYETREDLNAAANEDLADADLVGHVTDGGRGLIRVWKDRNGLDRLVTQPEWVALVEQVRRERGPDDGTWPCQYPVPSRELPERLVAFLYRALRDGVGGPGAVEQVAIEVGPHLGTATKFTNAYLEGYARSLAAYLTETA